MGPLVFSFYIASINELCRYFSRIERIDNKGQQVHACHYYYQTDNFAIVGIHLLLESWRRWAMAVSLIPSINSQTKLGASTPRPIIYIFDPIHNLPSSDAKTQDWCRNILQDYFLRVP